MLSLGAYLIGRYQSWGFAIFVGLIVTIFRNPLRKGARSLVSHFTPRQGTMRLMKRLAKLAAVTIVAGAALYFIQPDLKVSGEFKVLPIHNAEVRAEVEGIVEEIVHDEGDKVAAGELIARLSDRDYRAELQKVTAEMAELEAKLKMLLAGSRPEEIELARASVSKGEERLKHARSLLTMEEQLYKDNLSSKKDFEVAAETVAARAGELQESKANLNLLLAGARSEEIEATQAAVQRLSSQQKYLQDQLQRLRIASPIAGIVTTHRLREKVGSDLKKGELFAEVHQLNTVNAEITVPEKEISDVRLGRPVSLKARAFPDVSFVGKVVSISPVASHAADGLPQRNFLVVTELDNGNQMLRSEMSGNAKISCGKRRLYEIVFRRIIRFVRVEFWSWW